MEGWATEQHENVAVVTFVHPPENLLGFRYLAELDQILVDLSDELSIRMIVITGGVEGFFVGHADLGDVEALMQGRKGAGEPDWWNLTLERISSISQPVVAAVNGQAWGGWLRTSAGLPDAGGKPERALPFRGGRRWGDSGRRRHAASAETSRTVCSCSHDHERGNGRRPAGIGARPGQCCAAPRRFHPTRSRLERTDRSPAASLACGGKTCTT